MFCEQCGNETKVASRYCWKCGAQLQDESRIPEAAPFRYSFAGGAEFPAANIQPELNGVSGWLLVFCLQVVVIVPSLILISGVREPVYWEWVSRVFATFGVVVGTILWSKQPGALTLVRVFVVASLILKIGRLFTGLTTIDFSKDAAVAIGEVAIHLTSIAIGILWIGYFHFSKRVKATYGANI